MSEQSGGGHITREQVERAAKAELSHDVDDILGPLWTTHAPKYVRDAWHRSWRAEIGDTEHAALTRWRDELAAAEPVRRVARWDAYALAYAAKNADGAVHYYQHADRAKADGYEIEGGPEPVADDSPERLRERRETLGWTLQEAGDQCGATDHGIEVLERRADKHAGLRARYAAALSAEEARRSAVGAWAANGGVLHYSPPAEPERPAPRFKVGDWVRHGTGMAWRVDEVRDLGDCYAFYGALGGFIEGPEVTLTLTTRDLAYDEPASPPAPEVVDVPQPTIIRKLYGKYEAEWRSDTGVLTLLTPVRFDPEPVPIALLRAMLEDIDAQQGGAS